MNRETLTRRLLLKYGANASILFVAGCSGPDTRSHNDSTDSGVDIDSGADTDLDTGAEDTGEAASCAATSPMIVGPFYLDIDEVRQDITEGLPGAPFTVRLVLVDAATCEPLAGVPVDIWHASPRGNYSGVDNGTVVPGTPDTTGETFMRGRQVTDADGVVTFETVYPGWYPVSVPHIHLTAAITEEASFTWQYYFDDAFSELVYTTVAPYSDRGVHKKWVRDVERLPEDLIVLPDGTAESMSLDLIVVIDLTSLSGPPEEYAG